jgi:hypothetical protein
VQWGRWARSQDRRMKPMHVRHPAVQRAHRRSMEQWHSVLSRMGMHMHAGPPVGRIMHSADSRRAREAHSFRRLVKCAARVNSTRCMRRLNLRVFRRVDRWTNSNKDGAWRFRPMEASWCNPLLLTIRGVEVSAHSRGQRTAACGAKQTFSR